MRTTGSVVMAATLVAAAGLASAGEPVRTVILENAKVRVVDVAFAPGDVETEHTHPFDLVVVALTPGGIESTAPDGTKQRLVPKPGDVHFFPKGSTHTSRNLGEDPVRLRAIFVK